MTSMPTTTSNCLQSSIYSFDKYYVPVKPEFVVKMRKGPCHAVSRLNQKAVEISNIFRGALGLPLIKSAGHPSLVHISNKLRAYLLTGRQVEGPHKQSAKSSARKTSEYFYHWFTIYVVYTKSFVQGTMCSVAKHKKSAKSSARKTSEYIYHWFTVYIFCF